MQQQKQHSTTNSSKHNFELMSVENIIGGKTADGIRYLELFLREYTDLFSEQVNAGCNKCIANYLQKYKLKKYEMETNCKYKLQLKYNGLPLAFGSNIRVTNLNITDEYAEALIKRYTEANPEFHPSLLFDKYPEPNVKEIEVISEPLEAPKQKKGSLKRK